MGTVKTIGIVGGGQLGRMLTLAALPLGFEVVVVDPGEHCPAAQVGAAHIQAGLYNRAALQELAGRADYITVEIEHLDAGILQTLADQGARVDPAPATIRLIQDKLSQKEFFSKAGIPVAPFRALDSIATAEDALRQFGGRMLIKARHGAYDGRGNMVAKNRGDITKAFALFEGRQLYAEGHIPFKKELAVMAARDKQGTVAVYPVVETIHRRNICLEVRAPAPITSQERSRAEAVAARTARLCGGAGVFGIEMFLANDGAVLVNEIAPRVHNSGHYTIEAAYTSQFEQHIRAISGLPLGDAGMAVPAAAMVNILGERNAPQQLTGLADALRISRTKTHLYGKSPTKIDRKMGHITAVGTTIEQAKRRARRARQRITI